MPGDPVNVSDAVHRLGEDRPNARCDRHLNPREHQGNHDVREEHRGIDAVTPHRLAGYLRSQLRIEAGLQHGDPLSRIAILW